MLLSKAITIFETILDKSASPNVVQSEIIDYLNMATNEYLNRLVPDSQGGVVNFDFDANTLAEIQPLVFHIGGSLTPATGTDEGLISNLKINTALSFFVGAAATYFRIIAVQLLQGTYPYLRYVSPNKWYAISQNSFKKQSLEQPVYTLDKRGIFVSPPTLSQIQMIVIKTPKVYTVGDLSSQMELTDYSMYNIISIALKIAGVGVRDEELINDVRMTGNMIQQ